MKAKPDRTRLASHRALGAIAMLLVAIAAGVPSPVSAGGPGSSDHDSYALEYGAGPYVGMRERHKAIIPVGQPATGCSMPLAGATQYQFGHVGGLGASKWVELGTGIQCAGTYAYTYWGKGDSLCGTSTACFFLVGATGLDQNLHTYEMNSLGAPGWNFVIDGVVKGSVNTPNGGSIGLSAGLGNESFQTQTAVHTYRQLQYNSGSGFVPWTGVGQAVVSFNGTAIMCGDFDDPDKWAAGQNVTAVTGPCP